MVIIVNIWPLYDVRPAYVEPAMGCSPSTNAAGVGGRISRVLPDAIPVVCGSSLACRFGSGLNVGATSRCRLALATLATGTCTGLSWCAHRSAAAIMLRSGAGSRGGAGGFFLGPSRVIGGCALSHMSGLQPVLGGWSVGRNTILVLFSSRRSPSWRCLGV